MNPDPVTAFDRLLNVNVARFTSRLGDRIRMSTMGEFCGWNTAPDPGADAYFRAAAKERMPTLCEAIDGTETVCGLRPYSNDGVG